MNIKKIYCDIRKYCSYNYLEYLISNEERKLNITKKDFILIETLEDLEKKLETSIKLYYREKDGRVKNKFFRKSIRYGIQMDYIEKKLNLSYV